MKEKILFAQNNLTKDVGFTKISLVSCGNVLIYLQSKLQLQQQVLRNLHFSLAIKRILFLGKSENLAEIASEFTVLDRKKRDVRWSASLKSIELPYLISSDG